MSVRPARYLVCDGCDASGPVSVEKADDLRCAMHREEEGGWRHKNGKDFCGPCAEKRGLKPNAAPREASTASPESYGWPDDDPMLALRELAESPLTFEDPRVGYVEMRVPKSTLANARDLLHRKGGGV